MEGKMGFGTKAIHAGKMKDKQYGSLTMPIYQTSTYEFANCEQGGNRFAGSEDGFIYSRLGNPTNMSLENKLAALEGAEASVSFSSGMGAIAATVWTICKAGDHIVADSTLYGGTFSLLSQGVTKYGVEVTLVDLSDAKALKAELKENTVMVYVETPANPNMKIIDLEEVATVTHTYNKNIKVVVDNTFATPYLQRPIELGCDVAIHSATKYLNGHGDVIAGAVCGKAELIREIRLFGLATATGSVLGAFEAYLILRGLKTLELRMQRHCASATILAEFLNNHPKITKVYFPGLSDHPNHEIAKKQMADFGGMISFEVSSKADGIKLLDNLELCTLAVSLGDAETLVEHPASMTHATYSPEELAESGIPEGLVRLAVGLENVEDIIADLEKGLALL